MFFEFEFEWLLSFSLITMQPSLYLYNGQLGGGNVATCIDNGENKLTWS